MNVSIAARPIRLLLVEDNPGDADLTREVLESGKVLVAVDVVEDGEKALDYLMKRGPYASADTPDLIFLDINLPKLHGRQVLAEIRSHAHLRAVPVVMLTSSNAEEDIAECYALGANCFVTKPVRLDEFQNIIRAIEGFWFTIVRLP